MAERRVDSGQDLGQLFHLDDVAAADAEGVGHLQADVPGADDDRGGRAVSSRVRMTAKVSPIECSRCTPCWGQEHPSHADRGRTGDRAGADDQLVVGQQFLIPVPGCDEEFAPADVECGARVVSSRSRIPVASRSAVVRWARLRQ